MSESRTRYLDSIKPGVGGLMRTYRDFVDAALLHVKLKCFVPLLRLSVSCEFAQESPCVSC
ncbi:hypothetical protein [Microbulbifer sp. 2205BS26-8]|uniref:hypothetical protein n=1 Tax=Microbulbifer sp. 2205BS26-8 TaxID=3064386 RepID=UPI00273F57D0|nr:hypothetical protein [Microbulbifer sp. 2205BS26-8]MDP5211212.1 hypothetical protein [Microbulbifer sp. 2205BS26-8]